AEPQLHPVRADWIVRRTEQSDAVVGMRIVREPFVRVEALEHVEHAAVSQNLLVAVVDLLADRQVLRRKLAWSGTIRARSQSRSTAMLCLAAQACCNITRQGRSEAGRVGGPSVARQKHSRASRRNLPIAGVQFQLSERGYA